MSTTISVIDRLLNMIQVIEKNNIITIYGVKGDKLVDDIGSYWGTSKINKWLFITVTSTSFSYHSFFNPDIFFILQTLIKDEKNWKISKTTLKIICEELISNTQLFKNKLSFKTKLNYNNLNKLKKTPLPHQLEFFRQYDYNTQIYNLNGFLLASAPGTGKTLSIIMLALLRDSDFIFINAPKNSINDVWIKTLENEFKITESIWSSLDNMGYNGQKWIVGHYEALDELIEISENIKFTNPFVGLDESHNFNESLTLRTELFLQLTSNLKCKDVLWASGTPVKAMGYEMIPFLKTVDPLFNPDVEQRFRKIYTNTTGQANEILRNRLGFSSIKIEKLHNDENETEIIKVKIPNGDDYLLSKIKDEIKIFIVDKLEYYKKNRKSYEKIFYDTLTTYEYSLLTNEEKSNFKIYKNNINKILSTKNLSLVKEEIVFCNKYEKINIIPRLDSKEQKNTFKDVKSIVKYVHLKVAGEALGKILGQKRIQCHLDMIPFIKLEKLIPRAAKKTLIFTSYVEVLKAIEEYLIEKNFNPLCVYADTNKNLSYIINQFEKNEKENPLIATFKSLSTAIPLVMANQTIFINQPYRIHEKEQAKARTSRLGQDTTVHFVDILLDTGNNPNISTRSQDILEWSKQQVLEIMGDNLSDELNEEINIDLEE